MSLRDALENVIAPAWSDGCITIKPLTTESDLIYAAYECRLTGEQQELVNPAWFSIGRAYLFPEDNYPCIICSEKEGSIGFINFGRWLGQGDACTWSFFIDTAHQGKGYGRRAAEAAIRILKRSGAAKQVKLAAEKDNAGAQRLYASLGFALLPELDGDDLVYGISFDSDAPLETAGTDEDTQKKTPEDRETRMDREEIRKLFEKYCQKLRITPGWDVRLEFVEDPAWPKTGDFKIDCDDRKAILLLNAASPKQENMEEVIVHELMHLKMYPLDQVTESLIINSFEEGSAASNFAYQQFFTALEQTVEELTKCFLLEFGENKEFSYGRCRGMKSFNELYDGLRSIE